MRRALLTLILPLCLLLGGCGSRDLKNRCEAFSSELNAKETLTFDADLRAEYPDRTLRFTLGYEKNAEGQSIRVIEPALIAGIRAQIAPGSSRLEYDGMILDTGPLDAYGLTPVNALPKLVEAMAQGHRDSCWEENGLPVLRLVLDDHLAATVFFDAAMVPQRAELMSDGAVCVFCEISNWS